MNRIIGAGLIIVFLSVFVLAFPFFVHAIDIVLSNPSVGGDDEVTVDVSVTGLSQSSCPNTKCFLQAMLLSLLRGLSILVTR